MFEIVNRDIKLCKNEYFNAFGHKKLKNYCRLLGLGITDKRGRDHIGYIYILFTLFSFIYFIDRYNVYIL